MGNTSGRELVQLSMTDFIVHCLRNDKKTKLINGLVKFIDGNVFDPKYISAMTLMEAIKIMMIVNQNKKMWETGCQNIDVDEHTIYILENIAINLDTKLLPEMIELLFFNKIDSQYIKLFTDKIIKKYKNNKMYVVYISHYFFLKRRLTFSDEMVKYILDFLKENDMIKCNININQVAEYNGNTLLMEVAKTNNIVLIKFLLDNCANFRQFNNFGESYYDFLNAELKNTFKKFDPCGSDNSMLSEDLIFF